MSVKLFFVLFLTPQLFGHAGESHDEEEDAIEAAESADEAKKAAVEVSQEKLERVNELYESSVLPIFKKACWDCHTAKTRYPWYYSMPMVKGMIDEDIAEASKHLKLGESFPFGGHGSPAEDLQAIGESVATGHMPPLEYQLMHWQSFLGNDEKAAILKWVKDGMEILAE